MRAFDAPARWRGLPLRTRRAIVLAAATLAVLALPAALALRDTRVPLFAAPLARDQLAEVDAQLSAWSVVFSPGADNVRVEPKRRAALLARLALAGIPHAHVIGTAEALAAVGTLTPQVVLDAQARAGLEGDLSKGLRGIGGIADARVIVAPVRSGVFADEPSSDASASVRLVAEPGMTLTAATLSAVRAFVAAGVPGLRPDRVTVVDDRGAGPDEAGEARDRETALQSALDAAFGSDATIVRVHLEREDRIRESHDSRRVPHGAPIARESLGERFSGEKKSYVKTQTSEDRGNDFHEERIVVSPGALTRVSIAVIVDARRGLDLAKIRELAGAAGGIDRTRGDVLSIESVPFDRPNPRGAQPFAYALGALGEALPPLAFAVVGIVAVRAGTRPLTALAAELMRRVRLERTTREAAGRSPRSVFESLRREPPHAAAAVIATLAAPLATAVLDLYAPEQRAAIAVRLTRRFSPLVSDGESLLREP